MDMDLLEFLPEASRSAGTESIEAPLKAEKLIWSSPRYPRSGWICPYSSQSTHSSQALQSIKMNRQKNEAVSPAKKQTDFCPEAFTQVGYPGERCPGPSFEEANNNH
jgi:hypothetical protein